MGRSIKDKIEEIRGNLERKAEEEEPYDEISKDDVLREIYDIAGMDERTVDTYLSRMKDLGIIEVPGWLEEDESDIFKIDKKNEQTENDLDFTGEKKSVYVKAPKDLVEEAEGLGINKSATFQEALIDKISDMGQMINREVSNERSQQELELIKELIRKNCYLHGKKEKLRENLYLQHFEQINEAHLEELRRESAQVAENLGFLEKPEGL